jgi:UDP:flavonoid glycosyltransferase YjiC (YdhE family)
MEREIRAVRDGYAGRIATARAAGVASLAGRWMPDVLVCDELDFGATLAAERLGVPHARVLVIASGALTRPEVIAEPLAGLRAAHGLPPDPDFSRLNGDLVIAPIPPSLRDPALALPPMARSFAPPRTAEVPEAPPWLASLPHARTIYVTLGTVFNVESGDLFRRILQGISPLAANIVVTAGPQVAPEELGPQPANVRVERWLDQWAVLPRCDVVVAHAGSGTVIGALAHGLPMVLLPMGADQPFNAGRCADLGVARVLDPIDATPRQVRDAVLDVIDAPSCRAASMRIRDEMTALPDLSATIPLLERLVATRHPR